MDQCRTVVVPVRYQKHLELGGAENGWQARACRISTTCKCKGEAPFHSSLVYQVYSYNRPLDYADKT